MNRDERRALKRAQSGKFDRGLERPVPPELRATEARVLAEGIPIVWCEPTGVQRAHRGHWCDECKTYTQTEAPLEEWDQDFPDPRPEIECRKCGKPARMNSRGLDDEMIRPDTGKIFRSYRDLPIGAVWEQQPWRRPKDKKPETRRNWISNRDQDGKPFPEPPEGEGKRCRFIDRPGPDRRVLICRLPDRTDWVIDSRANNCTMPLDDKHWCWVRVGKPEDGTLHVGKEGRTCAAGAGSIATGAYHGFLRHGRLVQC